MPRPLPSNVGGSGPIEPDAASSERLRSLTEVLLTTRAKMLGFAKAVAPAVEDVVREAPASARNHARGVHASMVSALGEMVAILDSHGIRPGETRLSGKAHLGADEGMREHFDRRGAIERRQALDAGGLERQWMDDHLSRAGQATKQLEREPFWGDATERRAPLALPAPGSRIRLTELERGVLRWVCLSVFYGEEPERPAGSYSDRKTALERLVGLGFIGRSGSRSGPWKPTPEGFEASGLLGNGRLEMDP